MVSLIRQWQNTSPVCCVHATVIVIGTTMFMVLLSWHGHCESLLGYVMNAAQLLAVGC